jgi:hypothetical protein
MYTALHPPVVGVGVGVGGLVGHGGGRAVTGEVKAEVSPSAARAWTRYWVGALNGCVNVVVVVVPARVNVPPTAARYTSYPMTPTSSTEAVQFSVTVNGLQLYETVSPPGTVGGVVSVS